MFVWIASPEAWIALVTLVALEIVLGIDNIIFITILVGKLPPEQRDKARRLGLSMAMISRLLLLLSIAWVIRLTAPLFTIFDVAVSGRDLVLLVGGLFLIAKSTHEIHSSLEEFTLNEAPQQSLGIKAAGAGFTSIIAQITVLDIVFSLDSVITAVGLVEHVPIMVIAIVLAVMVMMFAAKPIGDYVDSHPTLKMLALSFLILIGFTLMAEGLGVHVPKGYIYFAMAFSVGVEFLNLEVRRRMNARALKLDKPAEAHEDL